MLKYQRKARIPPVATGNPAPSIVELLSEVLEVGSAKREILPARLHVGTHARSAEVSLTMPSTLAILGDLASLTERRRSALRDLRSGDLGGERRPRAGLRVRECPREECCVRWEVVGERRARFCERDRSGMVGGDKMRDCRRK